MSTAPQPQSYKISNSLYLVSTPIQDPKNVKKVAQPLAINHIAVIDCSGSMYSDLPKIRDQMKRKLPKLLGINDTISIIWFSGRGQCGILLEAEPVGSLTDLLDVERAIDRWLQPQGMTGFKEPLEKVAELIAKIKRTNTNPFSLFFMSDGCDNQWSRPDILKAVDTAAGGLASATFVEYGYYADRNLLSAMAEKAGGTLIFAADFDKYQPEFETAISKKVSGAIRIEVPVVSDIIGNFAFTVANGDLTTYAVERGMVKVPEDVSAVWALSSRIPAGCACDNAASIIADEDDTPPSSIPECVSALYAAVSLYSVRMKSEVVLNILKCLGDVDFIEKFSTCFGKQKYSEFMDLAKRAAFDTKVRFTKGYDPDRVPADDAFTVLDLLEILRNSDDNEVCFDHPQFEYSRIGRARVNADDANPLVFEEDKADKGRYPITALTYNEERPNVSILVRKTGKVDITAKVPQDFRKKLPPKFPTFIFRNYAIIKDGLVNVKKLPVRITKDDAERLRRAMGATFKKVRGEALYEGVLDVGSLPVINRMMVKEASAEALFRMQFDLMSSRAAQKVYKYYLDQMKEKKESVSFKLTYGETAAEWLKTEGFTDYSGFSPKLVTANASDVYLDKELGVKIKGLSSLPSVEDVKARMATPTKKPTFSQSLMIPFIEEAEAEKGKLTSAAFKTWVERKAEDHIKATRRLLASMARIKFAIVIGQVWFKEFTSLDENSMKLTLGSNPDVQCEVEMKEVEIAI